MQIQYHQRLLLSLVTTLVCYSLITCDVKAQEWQSPLMTGLEQPFAQPVTSGISERFDSSAEFDHARPSITRTSYYSHRESFTNVSVDQGYQSSGQYECTNSTVCTEDCMEELPWWKRKAHKLNRKCYFNYHSYHPNALHPIVHPACQPGYGYYETCWRRIIPNPCHCPPQYSHDGSPPDAQGQFTAPMFNDDGKLPPVPSYDQ